MHQQNGNNQNQPPRTPTNPLLPQNHRPSNKPHNLIHHRHGFLFRTRVSLSQPLRPQSLLVLVRNSLSVSEISVSPTFKSMLTKSYLVRYIIVRWFLLCSVLFNVLVFMFLVLIIYLPFDLSFFVFVYVNYSH